MVCLIFIITINGALDGNMTVSMAQATVFLP